MFANLRIYIFLFYVITVCGFLALEYYLLHVTTVQNIFIFGIILVCVVVLSGVLISKLALDPLVEYVKNLQNLSKETLHELNLPISTITTNTQMLQKGVQDEKSIKRIKRIESACEMLKERYNELDYLIKMQSKQQVRELFDLKELIEHRVEFFHLLYPHISFSVQLNPLELYMDKTGLVKVIDNLIDNGVKYSQNSTDIEIKLENRKLEIIDHGVGMDEVELLKIFDNFYQKNVHMQGFGIGLAMAKRFCEANKIVLDIQSKPNEGTRVSLIF